MAAWYVQFIDGGALALASLFVLLGAGVRFFARGGPHALRPAAGGGGRNLGGGRHA